MIIKEMKKALRSEMDPHFEKRGFRYNSRLDTYTRKRGDVIHQLHIRLIPLRPGAEVVPSIGIRFNIIEEIFQPISGFGKETPTIGAAVWRLEGQPKSYKYTLLSPDDVQPIAVQIIRILLEKALPYYEAYSSVEAIDRLLNENPEADTPQIMMEWIRASTGLIAARLTGRGNYDKLVDLYRGKMVRMDKGFYLPKYEALVSVLNSVEVPSK